MHPKVRSVAFGIAGLFSLSVALPPGTSLNPHVKRQDPKFDFPGVRVLDNILCGKYGTAQSQNSYDMIDDLNNDSAEDIPAGGCRRFGCYNTSGIYVCNGNGNVITVTHADVAAYARLILDICGGDASTAVPVSGQAFTKDKGGYVSQICPDIIQSALTNPKSHNRTLLSASPIAATILVTHQVAMHIQAQAVRTLNLSAHSISGKIAKHCVICNRESYSLLRSG